MHAADYPLLLQPHLAERVWGAGALGKGIGEAWDLSVHENGPTVITNGVLKGVTLAALMQERAEDFGGPIRLLAKRLDCGENLSVQVHPKEGQPKTEAWIVLQAQEGSGVFHGFSSPTDAVRVSAAAKDGTLEPMLRFIEVHTGECIFVPSGTVHAIGGGLFLFEIQQNSDVTYRLFDWGRDRPLHLEKGLACSDFDAAPARPAPRPQSDGALRLVECEHFRVDRIDTHKPYRLEPLATWCAVLLVAGGARVGDLILRPGATLLLPRAAGLRYLEPRGACTALVYRP